MANSTYDISVGTEFCAQLSLCKAGMESVCADMGLVPRTVWRWLATNLDFWDMYTKARDFQTELLFDEISRIAYLPLTHNGEEVENGGLLLEGPMALAEVQRRKLIIDTLKFKLMKLQPKRFGDNRNVDVNVKVKHTVSAEQFNRLLDAAASVPLIEAPEYEDAEEVVAGAADDFAEIEDDDDLG